MTAPVVTPVARYHIVDTFPEFLRFWEEAQGHSPGALADLWRDRYMAQWPELLAKQQEDYRQQGFDWRVVAGARIFPRLAERLPAMRDAREGLLACVGSVYQTARARLGLDFDVVFVLYMGVVGAGWATTYAGRRACLFGLETLAECGWTSAGALAPFTAHELGHLVHQERRARASLAEGDSPLWQLYEEGFAQYCEHLAMGRQTWHEADQQPGWVEWCRSSRGWLAAEFLSTVAQGRPVRAFFGSWYTIRGRRQCGYFLGHELVRQWVGAQGLSAVAVLPADEVEQRGRDWLLGEAVGGCRTRPAGTRPNHCGAT